MRKNIIAGVVFTFFSMSLTAQISVTTTNTPADLVNNILLGNGVLASNISFIGEPSQKGYFNAMTGCNIGFTEGILLSSGNVSDCVPPNQPDNGTFNNPGDPDLLTVAQSVTSNPSSGMISETFDAAILEFDFVPDGNEVSFSFVFASEEYLSYVNEIFNDAFGFFISGPGISGPYAAPVGFPNGAANLALIPGTTDPITISTIYPFIDAANPGLNASYYIGTPQGHSFNGFTIPIDITFSVLCGETYHFKFAVADCEDDFLDTGVFLKAGSFNSEPLQLSTSSETNDQNIVEGCSKSTLYFTRNICQKDFGLNININYGGTASAGDLINLPSSVTIPINDTIAQFNYEAVIDNLTEGNESFEVYLNWEDKYGNPYFDTLYFTLVDGQPKAEFSLLDSLACNPAILSFSNESLYSSTFEWIVDSQGSTTVIGNANYSNIINNESTVTLIAKNGYDICNDTISETFILPTCVGAGNVFTPNNDNANEEYFLNVVNAKSIYLVILDRWGNIMFEKKGDMVDQPTWNGTTLSGNQVNDGVYFYRYEVIGSKDELLTGHGFVQVIH
jgi:gliding motility-associated-like protein